MLELNLMKTTEHDEVCKIKKEVEREKCKEIMSKLEVKNGETDSDLKDKVKEFAVFQKESKARGKEMEEQAREQESKLKKMERLNKGLAETVSYKETQMNEVDRNEKNEIKRIEKEVMEQESIN